MFISTMKPILLLALIAVVAGCSKGESSSIAAPVPAVSALNRRVSNREIPIRSSIDLVLLGDSLARGTGDESGSGLAGMLETELRSRGIGVDEADNLARDGARTNGLLARLGDSSVRRSIEDADVVVVSIGANDLFVDSRHRPGVSPDSVAAQVLERLDSIMSQIRELNPAARVFLIGLYNPFFDSEFSSVTARFIKKWNNALEDRYDRKDVTIIETYDVLDRPEMLGLDRFHPSAAGYRLIARRIAQEI